ncbi:unnamed protein product [Sphagnum troendelagicum]|uniref:Uncharacterized protein n=1 Tax=Sphagnum troendelagicum TaxID=128251 RepID=A0ABP0V0R6_9BRYO
MAAAAVTSYGVVAARAAAVCVVPRAALVLSCVFSSASMKKAHHPTSSTSRGYGRRARRGGNFGSLTRARASGISLLTASRVADGSEFVRIVGGGGGGSGAGAAGVHGVGKLLVLDEFFKSPNTSSGIHMRRDSDSLLETLIYYCDDEPSSSPESSSSSSSSSDSDHSNEEVELEEEEDAQCEPRHGVQLYMESSMHSLKQQQEAPNPKSLVFPTISHAREVSAMTSVSLEGGALVRVVAGTFSRVSIPPPLHDFLMLDISMRPGSAETFPLLASFGIVVYILEGVGIFQSTRFAEDPTSFYQNEGHGLYIPTRSMDEEGSSTDDLLHVRTHELSHLRFLLLGAPVSS